jgi:hypothetical protein
MTPKEKYEKESLTLKQSFFLIIIVILLLLFADNFMKI